MADATPLLDYSSAVSPPEQFSVNRSGSEQALSTYPKSLFAPAGP